MQVAVLLAEMAVVVVVTVVVVLIAVVVTVIAVVAVVVIVVAVVVAIVETAVFIVSAYRPFHSWVYKCFSYYFLLLASLGIVPAANEVNMRVKTAIEKPQVQYLPAETRVLFCSFPCLLNRPRGLSSEIGFHLTACLSAACTKRYGMVMPVHPCTDMQLDSTGREIIATCTTLQIFHSWQTWRVMQCLLCPLSLPDVCHQCSNASLSFGCVASTFEFSGFIARHFQELMIFLRNIQFTAVLRGLLLSAELLFVCWLLNVPATRKCISGTDLRRQFYVLPHRDRSCRPNFPSHPVTEHWHRANQSQHWPKNTRHLAG